LQKEEILRKNESYVNRQKRKKEGAGKRKKERDKIAKEVSKMGLLKELKK